MCPLFMEVVTKEWVITSPYWEVESAFVRLAHQARPGEKKKTSLCHVAGVS